MAAYVSTPRRWTSNPTTPSDSPQSTTSLSTGRYSLGAVAYNGYLYVMGGYDGSTYRNDVQYAPINADGTIGTWQSTTSFSTGRYGFGAVAYNGYMYVLGGFGGSYLDDVQYARIGPVSTTTPASGTTNAWADTTAFADSRRGAASAVYNGHLYVMGGYSATLGYMSDVQYAPINADGSVGSWSATTSLPAPRVNAQAVAYRGYLYLLGGSSSTSKTNVFYAPINSDGTIGSWANTTSLPTVLTQHAAAVYGGYMYVSGGIDDYSQSKTASVIYAPISADGTIGSWQSTTSLPTAVELHVSVAYNSYLYVLGGQDDVSGTRDQVLYAPINSDGSIGAWTATTSLATPLRMFGSVAYNGFLYVVGGYGSTAYDDVRYAPINANGTIGNWTSTASLVHRTYDSNAEVYGGHVYAVGSRSSSVVEYASLNVQDHVGHYSKLIDFGMPVNITSIDYSPSWLPAGSSVTYRAAGADGVFGPMYASSNVSGVGGCTGNTQQIRYLFVMATLDDSRSAVVPDPGSTPTQMTELTVNYHPKHPPPDIRLRGGKTLQHGVLSPLDTCHP